MAKLNSFAKNREVARIKREIKGSKVDLLVYKTPKKNFAYVVNP